MELNIIRMKFKDQLKISVIYSLVVGCLYTIKKSIHIHYFEPIYLLSIPLIFLFFVVLLGIVFIMRPLYQIPSILVSFFTTNDKILKKIDMYYSWCITFSVALVYLFLAIEMIRK